VRQLNQPSRLSQRSPVRQESVSLKSGLSVPSLTQGTGIDQAKDKEEMDDTEAFITHSDHVAKGEPNEQYCLTLAQPNRMIQKLEVPNSFSSEEHPNTERQAELASIDSLYSG
jgi:hypothetical protein